MLKGKTAVVTGSTSGIGLGIAEALAAEGADIVINSFTDRAEDHAIAERLAAEHGVTARYVAADMSRQEDCRRLIETAAEIGPVQVLVNNAGVQHVARVEDFPAEKWYAIIAINLSSAFFTIAAAVPAMRQAGWGRIVNIASAHGLTASPYKSAYVSAKHGVLGLTKTVALELAEAGVTCNAICPAYVKTPLVEGQIADQMKAHAMDRETVIREVMLERQPTKEFVKVSDVAAMTLFLCSDAAAQITGVPISIDGGWTAM
ncbi:3-hydroxybutyrate dehydrogenase [Afifella pfennigii]|uniref:3-hydroxybutyrate dehydrogenase n=1 Tax=Afifella pfennigii TaxID=209897 RepID=UPI00047BEB53|nr:3-hydroxybutyrate dehydrogenase [Afifella pfennigii]